MEKIGKYVIQSKIGEGGMGVVYKAFDPLFERIVAVKTISAQRFSDPDFCNRFFREARSTGKLNHANIITVYDLGEDGGRPYLVMEYLEGRDLKTEISSQKAMPLEQRLRVMIEVCRGVSYAHQMGIIHRDIKPGNIFITTSGQVKILDFGLARAVSSASMTTKSSVLGTPSYMSPEQWVNSKVDQRSDIFAAGTLFYELLTFKKAFDGDTYEQIYYKIFHTYPEPIEKVNPRIPPQLSAIVLQAMAREPAKRYQHMAEVLRDLEAFRVSLDERKRSLRAEAMEAVGKLQRLLKENKELTEEEPVDPESTVRIVPSFLRAPATSDGDRSATLWSPPREYFDLLEVCQQAKYEHDRLIALIEKRQKAAALLGQAIALEKSGHIERALELLNGILKDDPGYIPAASLREELSARLEQQRTEQQKALQAEELFQKALSHFSSDDIFRCQTLLNDALKLQPGHQAAIALRDSVQSKIREQAELEEKRRRADEALAAAVRALDVQDFAQARKELDSARAIYPEAPRIAALLQAIDRAEEELHSRKDRELKVDKLIEEAQSLHDKGEEELAVSRLNELLVLEPAHIAARKLKREIEKRRELRQRAAEVFQQAESAFSSDDLSGCQALLDQVLKLQPGHQAATALREGVQQKIRERAELEERRRGSNEALDAAMRALASEDVHKARREAERARALCPEAPGVSEVLQAIDRAEEGFRIRRGQERSTDSTSKRLSRSTRREKKKSQSPGSAN